MTKIDPSHIKGPMRCGYQVVSTLQARHWCSVNSGHYYDDVSGGWVPGSRIWSSQEARENDGSLTWAGEAAADVRYLGRQNLVGRGGGGHDWWPRMSWGWERRVRNVSRLLLVRCMGVRLLRRAEWEHQAMSTKWKTMEHPNLNESSVYRVCLQN